MAGKHVERAALTVPTDTTESGGLSNDMDLVDLAVKTEGSPSAEATFSSSFAENGDENKFEEVINCVAVECRERKWKEMSFGSGDGPAWGDENRGRE